MVKKIIKDVGNLTQAGVGLGVGTLVVSKTQQGSGINVLPAFQTAGSMLGPTSSVVMGGNMLRITKKSFKTKKKKGGLI